MNDWADYFYYDETSPSCLRWKVDRYTGRDARITLPLAGTTAGCRDKEYYRVGFGGSLFQVHRVIWELHSGPIPEDMVIDHKDRNMFNNKLDNLRLVPFAINKRNATMLRNNTSGITGVSYEERAGRGYWRARWKGLDGKRYSSNFPTAAYGDKAFELACKAREEAIAKLNTEGAGYTSDHGKTVT